MSRVLYPFTAIVGQEKMKLALVLNAIQPRLGGVLIRGHKGTAKSTAARGLARLLPEIDVVAGCPFHCDPAQPQALCPVCQEAASRQMPLPTCRRPMPVVDLPLGATEDRLIGTLHLETALRQGQRVLEPGLLASAHRGVLYVDEVNLLDDHLVDVLLDVAAMGVNVVEREGVSVSHPAQFLLIGTMNPEEGELRPQFLDRFGLCVEVTGIDTPADRAEIVRRRLRFEADPDGCRAQWHAAERDLAQRIAAAQHLLSDVTCADALLEEVARLTVRMQVHGHRADLALVQTARALAAYEQRLEVTPADIRTAAELVLPHRLRHNPLEREADSRRQLEQTLHQHFPTPPPTASSRNIPEHDGQDTAAVKKNYRVTP
ncbi:MAG: ATP-binding protein [Gemmataceae bacterium]